MPPRTQVRFALRTIPAAAPFAPSQNQKRRPILLAAQHASLRPIFLAHGLVEFLPLILDLAGHARVRFSFLKPHLGRELSMARQPFAFQIARQDCRFYGTAW